jgi:type I restriction enzyme S subunit
VVRWRETTLGSLLSIKHGFAFLGEYFADAGTHVVLTPGNFEERGGFRSKGKKEKWYTGPVPPEYVLRRGDVLIAMTEQAEGLLGSSAIVPEDDLYLHNQRLGLVQARGGADLRFLYHLFKSRDVRQQIRASASGTKVRHTAPSRVEAVRVRVPDEVTEQRRIAGILSAYDELIENCERRIRVLDEMVRALYREWFVLFRYPGHEKMPLVDSPMGPVPKGWKVTPASSALAINPKVILPPEGDRAFVPMGSLSNETMCISDIESRTATSGAKFQNGDTLFARITPCLENGKTGFVQFLPDASAAACGSTEFIVLRGKSVPSEFVYCLARSAEFRHHAIKSMSGATGRQRVQERCFDNFLLAHPSDELLKLFAETVRPSFELTQVLHRRVENLRQARDLLVPRLLSGQLSVEPAA